MCTTANFDAASSILIRAQGGIYHDCDGRQITDPRALDRLEREMEARMDREMDREMEDY